MKTLSFIITGCLVLLATLTAGAADGPNLVKISEHVYAYVGLTNATPASGFGANTGVIIGRDSVAVIDTLISAKAASRFLEQIREITSKPIRYVVDTHSHLDHAWGNCVFASQGAVVIGQTNTRKEMLSPANSLSRAAFYGIPSDQLEGTTLVPPTITFDRTLTIDLGDVTVELTCFAPSHTEGSTVAIVPTDKVLITGDILFTHYHPNLGSGNLESWLQVLADLKKIPAVAIVPGHGPLSTGADLQEMADYIRVFDKEAKRLCAGKTAADAPAIANELEKLLPAQNRTELVFLIKANLVNRYLPKE